MHYHRGYLPYDGYGTDCYDYYLQSNTTLPPYCG